MKVLKIMIQEKPRQALNDKRTFNYTQERLEHKTLEWRGKRITCILIFLFATIFAWFL